MDWTTRTADMADPSGIFRPTERLASFYRQSVRDTRRLFVLVRAALAVAARRRPRGRDGLPLFKRPWGKSKGTKGEGSRNR